MAGRDVHHQSWKRGRTVHQDIQGTVPPHLFSSGYVLGEGSRHRTQKGKAPMNFAWDRPRRDLQMKDWIHWSTCFFFSIKWVMIPNWRYNIRKSHLLYDRFHLTRQSLLLHSKLPPVLYILLSHSMLGLIVVRLYHSEVGHIPVHLWQSLHRIYIGWDHHTNHCASSVYPNKSHEIDSLVYHQSTNCDFFTSYLTSFYLDILFVKECNKARSIMTTVAFRRKNKPGMRSAGEHSTTRIIMNAIVNVLSWFKLGKLTGFEQNLKCLPDKRRSWRSAVDSVGTKRKSRPDRLVNINHLNDIWYVNVACPLSVIGSLTITDIVPTIFFMRRTWAQLLSDKLSKSPERINGSRFSVRIYQTWSIFCKRIISNWLRHNFSEINLPRKSPIIDEHPGPPFNLANIIISSPHKTDYKNKPKCERSRFRRISWLKEPEPLIPRSVTDRWCSIGKKCSPLTCSFQHRHSQISAEHLGLSRKHPNLWQNV